MKRQIVWTAVAVAMLVTMAGTARAQEKKPVTLRELLVRELRSTHNDNKDWFVPAMVAVKGLTAEQANWKDGKGNHSVGQLTYHLLFWNKRNLMNLKGEKAGQFSGNNDETFDNFDAKKWEDTVKELDSVMTEMEKWVETADEEKLQKAAQLFANISTHNAYHVGQIIYVRKEQGSWDPNNGIR
jgi:DinB family protein